MWFFKPCTVMAGYMPHCIRDPDGEVLCCLDDFSPAKALSLLAAGVPSRCSSWIFSCRTPSSLPKCFNQPNYSVQETEARNVFQLILLLKSQSEIRIKFLINSKQWPASFGFLSRYFDSQHAVTFGSVFAEKPQALMNHKASLLWKALGVRDGLCFKGSFTTAWATCG